VFFVLCGFFITTLLLRDFTQEKRFDLARFWSQRARHLLPPLFVLIADAPVLARFVDDPGDRHASAR
jgi:peptidoglycan/LPS O-acetylase OafA/YrhL